MPFPVYKIKQLCKEHDTDIKHLERELSAKGFSFSNSTIARWENAKRLPPYEKVKAVANYFNVSIAWLSDGAYPDDNTNNTNLAPMYEREYAKLIQNLCANDLEKLRRLQDSYSKNPERTKSTFDLFLEAL